ncbi:hypothetical protein R2601_03373 [Salipiger bermudensis HTCC2601]|uniref:Uncharacterized protein n=1 Tax=Salipiger bermudensis (strain DSM 26914 / JCM 13377 / KCTC 12554 / HTCC2601) TaxID=314265 RepID=Q0FWH1_SALBH|nr:hypothetical protein R2601_03373 [Salipiger bermudensis HTCC2601]
MPRVSSAKTTAATRHQTMSSQARSRLGSMSRTRVMLT